MSLEAHVSFECPAELFDQARRIISGHNSYFSEDYCGKNAYNVGTITELALGRIDPDQQELSDELTDAGIPHSMLVSSDYDVEETYYHTQFTADGKVIQKTIFASDRSLPVEDLLKLIDKPEELREFILERDKYLAILPWDNQLEYSAPARLAARL